MCANETIHYKNIDMRIVIGNLYLNILYVDYESPRPSWYYGSHSHSSYELHLIPSGNGIIRATGQEYKIFPGTFYLTGPGIVHEQKADAIDPMCEYCINFEIKYLKRKSIKSDIYPKNEVDYIYNLLKNTVFWFGKDEYKSEEIFIKVMDELKSNLIGGYIYIQSLLTQIILNAIRSFSTYKKSEVVLPKKTLNDKRRCLVDNYFRDFDKPLSPGELSNIIGTSVRQLERILRRYYNMTFYEKLTIIRLDEAKKIILESSLSIQKVSELVGFSHQDILTKTFKKHYNITPGKFRLQDK